MSRGGFVFDDEAYELWNRANYLAYLDVARRCIPRWQKGAVRIEYLRQILATNQGSAG